MQRCTWPGNDALMTRYHDREWGVPVHRDRKLFEFLVLETFQAGLSWRTVLYKRPAFRRAFARFHIDQVARFSATHPRKLLGDPAIIRNRQKIRAAINNARRTQAVQKEFGSLSKYFWDWVGNRPVVNHWRRNQEIPAVTPLAERVARDLKQRGFQFMGPTVVYAHLQATGIVNDHLVGCFRHRELRD